VAVRQQARVSEDKRLDVGNRVNRQNVIASISLKGQVDRTNHHLISTGDNALNSDVVGVSRQGQVTSGLLVIQPRSSHSTLYPEIHLGRISRTVKNANRGLLGRQAIQADYTQIRRQTSAIARNGGVNTSRIQSNTGFDGLGFGTSGRDDDVIVAFGQAYVASLCLEGNIGERGAGISDRGANSHHIDIHIARQGRSVHQTNLGFGRYRTVIVGQQQGFYVGQFAYRNQGVGSAVRQRHIGIDHHRRAGAVGHHLEVVGSSGQIQIVGCLGEGQIHDRGSGTVIGGHIHGGGI